MWKYAHVFMTAIFKKIAVDGFFEFQKTEKDVFSRNNNMRF